MGTGTDSNRTINLLDLPLEVLDLILHKTDLRSTGNFMSVCNATSNIIFRPNVLLRIILTQQNNAYHLVKLKEKLDRIGYDLTTLDDTFKKIMEAYGLDDTIKSFYPNPKSRVHKRTFPTQYERFLHYYNIACNHSAAQEIRTQF